FTRSGLPAPVVAFFTKDVFYGMPLSNWFGWFVTGVLISRLVLGFAPPSLVASRLSPTSLPIVLYAVNGIMPIAICARDGMTWAAVLGTIAMLVPVALALRARSLGAEDVRQKTAPALA
ncbi:MAG: carotenoid biosynthesis protein, partial [Gemmatimonadota bacterium]